MRRVVVCVLALAACLVAAAPALASPEDDARAVADEFLHALVNRDGQTACGLMAPELVSALGGEQKCTETLSEDTASTSDETDLEDTLTRSLLLSVYNDARALSLARGGYVTKTASLKVLVRQLHTLEPRLTFSIGDGPGAAKKSGLLAIVVDRRTSRRELLAYAKSASGTIFRLDAHGTSSRSITAAGKGDAIPSSQPTPTPTTPPSYAIGTVFLSDPATAYVSVTLTQGSESVQALLRLVFDGTSWRIADLYASLLSALTQLSSGG